MIRAAALIALLAAAPASAHSWYQSACCSGRDCAPIRVEAVEVTPDGYLVTVEPGDHPFITERTQQLYRFVDAAALPLRRRGTRREDRRWRSRSAAGPGRALPSVRRRAHRAAALPVRSGDGGVKQSRRMSLAESVAVSVVRSYALRRLFEFIR